MLVDSGRQNKRVVDSFAGGQWKAEQECGGFLRWWIVEGRTSECWIPLLVDSGRQNKGVMDSFAGGQWKAEQASVGFLCWWTVEGRTRE